MLLLLAHLHHPSMLLLLLDSLTALLHHSLAASVTKIPLNGCSPPSAKRVCQLDASMRANGQQVEANVGLFTFQPAPKASAAFSRRATQNLCLLSSQFCHRLTDVSQSCAFSSSEWPHSVLHLITTLVDRNAPFPPPSWQRRRRSSACQGKRPQVQCPLRLHSGAADQRALCNF